MDADPTARDGFGQTRLNQFVHSLFLFKRLIFDAGPSRTRQIPRNVEIRYGLRSSQNMDLVRMSLFCKRLDGNFGDIANINHADPRIADC